jgi:hypothetical protein
MALGLLRGFRIAGEADAKQERFEENWEPFEENRSRLRGTGDV